jgi:nucleoside-triphosphatase
MKHIFLTGDMQIGKSTVILKTLQLLNVKFGGFRTYFGADRSNPNRCLYMSSASLPAKYDESSVVARFTPVSPPEIFPERFNALGVEYIKEALKTADLIVMDELGNLENTALRFQNAVLDTLNGDVPILGVIKLSATGWVDKIRNHPKVELVHVDKENRDALPNALISYL